MKALQRVMWLALVGILVGASSAEAQFNDAPGEADPSVAPAQPAPDTFDPAQPAPDDFDPAQPAPDGFDPPQPAPDEFDPAPPVADSVDPAPDAREADPFDPLSPGVPDTPEPADQPYSPMPGGAPGLATPDSPLEMQSAIDPFLPPSGMTTAPYCLIEAMGFYGHHPFVYSASNCFDLASACYKYGYYEDAIALLSHAIEQEPMAHYYYLRGMSQMKAGQAYEAMASADGVWDALSAGRAGGLARVRERFNGPVAWQFRQLIDMRGPAVDGRRP